MVKAHFFRVFVLLASLLAWTLLASGQVGSNQSIARLTSALSAGGSEEHQARLSLDLALAYVIQPGEDKSDLDSAMVLIERARSLNRGLNSSLLHARLNYVLARALREKGDTSRAHLAIDSAIDGFSKTSGNTELAEAWIERANYYDWRNRASLPEKKRCFQQALAIYRSSGEIEKQADLLKDLGDFNQVLRNYGEALVDLREALGLYQASGHKALQGVYDLLGLISSNIGDYTAAVKYGLLAVQTADEVHDTSMQLCTIYCRLAVSYMNWLKRDSATTCLKKALAIALKYKDLDGIETSLLNLCYLLHEGSDWKAILSLVRTAEQRYTPRNLEDSLDLKVFYVMVYTAGHRYSDGAPYANMLVSMVPRLLASGLYLPSVYSSLTNYFLGTGDHALAEKYASAYLDYSARYGNQRTISNAYWAKARVDSAAGNLLSAYVYYQRFKKLSDSVLNEAKSFQYAQMQVVYETGKKDQEIALQDLKIKKAAITRTYIIVTSVALLLLALIGYRFKERKNAKLRAQQQEIGMQNLRLTESLDVQKKLVEEKAWLVKEIHHRVKNNLQIVISLLNAQSDFLDNPAALSAIRDSRERMQAIAVIHQKLYKPDQNTAVNMHSYVHEMVSYLADSFGEPGAIRFVLDILPIELDVSQAVPVGLILNEAITNAIKYAFKRATRHPLVTILLVRLDEDQVLLKIADNGRGFPEDFDDSGENSLGTQLMRLFTEQLGGTLEFRNADGAEVSLRFDSRVAVDIPSNQFNLSEPWKK